MLVIAVLVVGAIWYWYLDHRRLVKAREEYDRTQAQYEVGLLPSILDLCEASRRLAEAEEGSPFVSRIRARADGFLRVSDLESQYRVFIELSLFAEGGREQALNELHELGRRRMEARDRLREALGE
jgi:hypothetical protein